MIECPDCNGTGFCLIRDPGIAGAEEYGTCRRCHGKCCISEKFAPETLLREIVSLKARIRELEKNHEKNN